MAEPIAQLEIESEIMRLSQLAEKVTHTLAQRAREAALADATYKSNHAKALLKAEGTELARKAQADVDVADLYEKRRITEALLLSAQEAGRNTRAQLEALRSINANHRPLVSP